MGGIGFYRRNHWNVGGARNKRLALRTTQRMQAASAIQVYFLWHNADCRTRQDHAFDAVRAFALLAGIVQCGSMSFVAVSSPAHYISQSWILSVMYYVIQISGWPLLHDRWVFRADTLVSSRHTRVRSQSSACGFSYRWSWAGVFSGRLQT